MKRNRGLLAVLILLVSGFSCTKESTELVLNQDYLPVADVLEYCQGSCDMLLGWEGTETVVKGHIPDISNDSSLQDYISNQRFYLSDIRNGMFMEIRIKGDEDAIFGILDMIGKQDMVFIRGTAEPVIVNEGNECLKGVVIELDQSTNIQINL